MFKMECVNDAVKVFAKFDDDVCNSFENVVRNSMSGNISTYSPVGDSDAFVWAPFREKLSNHSKVHVMYCDDYLFRLR